MPKSKTGKVYLMILDGFGEGKSYKGNAIKLAKMPVLNSLKKEYPLTLLKASGEAIGLPAGTQGGSEVGHFTIGAGRVVFQTLEIINRSIRNKSFYKKTQFLKAVQQVKKYNSSLHLLGMISDQGIHSHLAHLFALLELAKKNSIKKVYIHAITDGRDVPEKSAQNYIKQINTKIKKLGFNKKNGPSAKIATIVGRYYAMDRDNNWNRTQKAYDLYTLGKGIKENDSIKAITNSYKRGATSDYYIEPVILDQNGIINKNDAVIFWNFRTDRTRQITYCFTGEKKIGFKQDKKIHPLFICFGDYSKKAPVVYPPVKVNNNLGEVIEKNHFTQLRIAETEKYAHVTFFFNSQIEKSSKHEKRILIKSPKVPSYAKKPEMSAAGITEKVIKEMQKNNYNLIIQNFANPDLVGHSGDLKATIKACEFLDDCIGQIVSIAKEKDYHIIITADHGNAEYKIYENNGQPCPSHSKNPVIFLLVSDRFKKSKLNQGSLQDIAPTILQLFKIKKPKEMTGKSLIINQT